MNTIKLKTIAAFVAISMVVTWFYMIRPLAMGVPGNSTNPWVFTSDATAYYHLHRIESFWQQRIGGLWIAGRMCDWGTKDGKLQRTTYCDLFATYQSFWLGLTLVAIVALLKEPLFVLFATFSGLFYMFSPSSGGYSYPWDFPAVFFFTTGYLFWMRGWYKLMLLPIVVGTLFKETPAIVAILFFFTPLPWRNRFTLFGIAFAACLTLKLVVSYEIAGHLSIFSQQYTAGHVPNFILNLKMLFHPALNHFIFVNAGTFLVALFLPVKTVFQRGTKTLLLVFFGGLFISGLFNEVREMLEAAPIAAVYLQDAMRKGAAGKNS